MVLSISVQFLCGSWLLLQVMIGDYFGQDDEFSLSVMHAYVDAMSFSDMRFDKALRAILFDIHLPREAEKVDRIIEKFAER